MKKQEQEPLQGTDSTETAAERPAVSHVWASFKRTVLEMFTELWGGVGNIKKQRCEQNPFTNTKRER